VTPLPRRLQALGAFMSFKNRWQRDKLRKRTNKGFRGYPAATISCYGPTDQRASKLVASIIQHEGAEPEPIRKWDSETLDVRTDPEITADVLRFLESNGAKSIAMADRIIGCPHEEGIDYPKGEPCPQCPFWANRDRFTGRLLQ
jgi:hypothetical protein